MNYRTERIINKVKQNFNNECWITLNAEKYPEPTKYKIGKTVIRLDEPHNPIYFEQYLEELFNNGAEIIYETLFGFDDEGGEAYTAFILKTGNVQKYNQYYINNMEVKGKNHSQICIMQYIIDNPDEIITINAAPY